MWICFPLLRGTPLRVIVSCVPFILLLFRTVLPINARSGAALAGLPHKVFVSKGAGIQLEVVVKGRDDGSGHMRVAFGIDVHAVGTQNGGLLTYQFAVPLAYRTAETGIIIFIVVRFRRNMAVSGCHGPSVKQRGGLIQ